MTNKAIFDTGRTDHDPQSLTTTGNFERRFERWPSANATAVVAESAAMRAVLEQVQQVAATPATVLLLGETGVGKEVIAEFIHDSSPRRSQRMVRVTCAAIPTALLENELFGRERGAYTGAVTRQIGRFEAANHSTLLLDEIGDLPLGVQVKLLRVLQERTIERLGSAQSTALDVRIIAATHGDLEQGVRDRTFREDLYYRLNVFPIVVPPLRQRVEDLDALAWSFIDEYSRTLNKRIDSIAPRSLEALRQHHWPGNVRELRNVIERAMIIANGRQLVVDVPKTSASHATTLTEIQASHIRGVLKATNWRVRGRGGAAERLGIKANTLESRMAKLGIARPKPADTSFAPIGPRHLSTEEEQP
jgi:transcriptional regulator with GAF, ATPase, and Fis domain